MDGLLRRVGLWLNRRRQAARTAELRLAGLAPVELPAALAERLRRLHAPGAALAFGGVWRTPYSDGELYALELRGAASEELVVFISSRLSLPRLHAVPRRRAAPGATRPGLSRVSFPDDPQLDAALAVFARDADRARAFLGGSRGLWLAQLPAAPPWDGEGDLLCVRSRALADARALYSVLTR